jgi:hypothetical protein
VSAAPDGPAVAPSRTPGTALGAVVALGLLMALAGTAAVSRSASAPGDTAPPVMHGSVTMEPGYHGIVDPESASVRIGRRTNAPLVKKRFVGGAPSLDALGRTVCRVLGSGVPDSLLLLCVHEDEFKDIMWREFPQSRPATGIQAADAWMFLWARLHGGSVQAMNEHGGHHYDFIRFDRYDTTAVYKNFKLCNGLVLVARDDLGQIQQFRWLRSAVERKGAFKIYSMRD